MKIEHVAIWVKDIDRVCEFYQKYFGGVVQPLYHNPAKQFTSRFITFEDGARLEVMHRPDIDSNDVETLTESNVGSNVGTAEMFHVKPLQGECSDHICMGIAEPKEVGHEVSQHLGFTHLSFSVGLKEKVDSLTQQMSDDGITIVGQPRTTGDGYYESVVLDPEGNRIEITV